METGISREEEKRRRETRQGKRQIDSHPIDETGEELGFVMAVLAVRKGEAFQPDRKADVAATSHVLQRKSGESGVLEAELFHQRVKLARTELGVLLRLGPGHHHLAALENQRRDFWVSHCQRAKEA